MCPSVWGVKLITGARLLICVTNWLKSDVRPITLSWSCVWFHYRNVLCCCQRHPLGLSHTLVMIHESRSAVPPPAVTPSSITSAVTWGGSPSSQSTSSDDVERAGWEHYPCCCKLPAVTPAPPIFIVSGGNLWTDSNALSHCWGTLSNSCCSSVLRGQRRSRARKTEAKGGKHRGIRTWSAKSWRNICTKNCVLIKSRSDYKFL